MTSAAAIAPIRAHSGSGRPRVSPNRKPAANRSPAPVVSTTRATGAAGTSWTASAVTTSEPSSERVITAISQRPRTAATAASVSPTS